MAQSKSENEQTTREPPMALTGGKSPSIQEIEGQTRPYTEQDIPRLLAFRQVMYGVHSIYADQAYLRWLYEPRANRDSNPSLNHLWMYEQQGQLVAHQGLIPIQLQVHPQLFHASWTTDLMLDPIYRRKGIGSAMQRRLMQESPNMLAMEVSDAARGAFLKAGWTDLGTLPLYIRPMQTQHRLGQVGRFLIDPMLRVGQALLERWLSAPGLTVQVVKALDAKSFDALWQQCAASLPVAVCRDSRYIQWRFFAYPERQRYTLLAVDVAQQRIGYCVVRVGQRKGQQVGYVVDILARPEHAAMVLLQGIAYLQRQQVALVHCLLQSPLLSPAQMASLGFVRRDSGWRLMYQMNQVPKQVLPIMQQINNWHITAADSDADRPREGIVYIAD